MINKPHDYHINLITRNNAILWDLFFVYCYNNTREVENSSNSGVSCIYTRKYHSSNRALFTVKIEDTYDTESAIAVEKMEKGVNELKEAGEHRDEQIETLVRPQISKATNDVVKATQLKKERFVNPGTAILPLYE
ncbi:uncharacterized protein LOC142355511 isoform X1 [Convolutriloba macropyga]|uniref:uncharacterized protein LOC142355511 isoform X1 n=1 Tax=Convolutriloba macropyga TaxID=536237 RepID=UPI003F51AE5D